MAHSKGLSNLTPQTDWESDFQPLVGYLNKGSQDLIYHGHVNSCNRESINAAVTLAFPWNGIKTLQRSGFWNCPQIPTQWPLCVHILWMLCCSTCHINQKSQLKFMNHLHPSWMLKLESTLIRIKPLTNGSNDDPNDTNQLRNLNKIQIMKEPRISVARARTFWTIFDLF